MKIWLSVLSVAALSGCADFSASQTTAQPAPNLLYATGNQFESLWAGDPVDRTIALGLMAQKITEYDTDHRYVCLRQGVTGMQLAKVVDAYISTTPQALDKPMWSITTTALSQAFPC